MVYVDVIAPTELILISNATQNNNARGGTIKLSGAKLYFHNGTSWELVTSS